MTDDFKQRQQTIYQEMMSHPALFTHRRPQKIAIIGEDNAGIAKEALKHPGITEIWQTHLSSDQKNEPRIKLLSTTDDCHGTFDIIILAAEKIPQPVSNYYHLLHNDGILLYQSASLFEWQKLKAQYTQLKSEGFYDIQILSFPQPDYPTGWRSALLAIKNTAFKHISEKNVFNRPFTTQYYNFDVHKASLALPEFIREELAL